MKLRDHPILISRGVQNWPPFWVCSDRSQEDFQGEAGFLTAARHHDIGRKHFFLDMKQNDATFTSCLFFDDPAFCDQIFELLKSCVGRTIHEIGDMDVSGILPLRSR